jgi:hypothetical protein
LALAVSWRKQYTKSSALALTGIKRLAAIAIAVNKEALLVNIFKFIISTWISPYLKMIKLILSQAIHLVNNKVKLFIKLNFDLLHQATALVEVMA